MQHIEKKHILSSAGADRICVLIFMFTPLREIIW